MADGPIRRAINTGEGTLRANLTTLADMSPAMDAIIAKSGGGPNTVVDNSLPTIGALANMKAVSTGQSQSRVNQANALINSLPQYTKGYRSYLKWRYPSRYGGGAGNTYPVYTGNGIYTGGGSGSPRPVPVMPDITEVP